MPNRNTLALFDAPSESAKPKQEMTTNLDAERQLTQKHQKLMQMED